VNDLDVACFPCSQAKIDTLGLAGSYATLADDMPIGAPSIDKENYGDANTF
jgi:hypothetical protein